MTADLKARVRAEIEAHAERIIAFSEDVMRRPEPGYSELATAARVAEWFEEQELDCRTGLARTGVKARLRGRRDGPVVGLLGELDAVVVPGHPLADPATGAAHACGHHAQLAAMLGAGLGLRAVCDEMDGGVALFAVPAEELVELDKRLALRDAGEIEFPVGKAELLRTGEFDDIDLAMLVHTAGQNAPRLSVGDTTNGALLVRATFVGVASHAGGHPWLGVNALKAATLAIAAIDAQRESFPEADSVRVNPIVTDTDTALGVVPATATLQVMVRARTSQALRDTAAKVERALRAGALALGAAVEVESLLGYLPLRTAPMLDDLLAGNAVDVLGVPPDQISRGRHIGVGTDMGDLGYVLPVAHPFVPGARGDPHGVDYQVVDHRVAAVESAILLATTVIDLLRDGATKAREVLAATETPTTKDEYLALRRELTGRKRFDYAEG